MATFMYRKGENGEAEARVFFEDETIPAGWVDSPAKIDEPAPKPKRKPRAAKAAD